MSKRESGAERTAALRRRLYEILEQAPRDDRLSLVVNRLLVLLIVVNLVAVVLQSVPSVAADYRIPFVAIEVVSLIVFTAEYGLRLWVSAEHAPYGVGQRDPRLAYAMSAAGIVDLLAILPFWIGLFFPADLRAFLVFRIVRFLKLVRYSPAMRSLLDALYAERRALLGCFVILVGVTLASASVMYLVERGVQPDKFGTIPDAMWWAIVTLGTVGYGDVVPVTAVGRVVAAFTIFGGLVMIALPVGIVATAFANEVHRRDFVVTWGMVARVPLFSGLNAGEIADIMRLLSAQTVEPGNIIVRRGEPGRSMYFIAAGEVEIELPKERLRLGVGHFFGEIAVLRRTRRSGTVTAIARTNLLVLDGSDLHALMERDSRLAKRIREVVRDRVGSEIVGHGGDLVSEEIEKGE
jgi:voltage-gated potassium channel